VRGARRVDAFRCDPMQFAAARPCPTLVAVPSVEGAQQRLLHVDHYDNLGAEVYEPWWR